MSNETTSSEETVQVETPSKWANGPEKLRRNEYGLFDNVDYKFTPSGRVDWRAMIDPQFLYPNADWFKARNQEVPDSIEGLEDNQLLIMLGGIKELAQLRGYSNVEHNIVHIHDGYVIDTCTITWIANYETKCGGSNYYDVVTFQDTANATFENCSGFGAKFLETIAANRAFVRAVRNFLNIHIVGADEIDKSKNKAIEVDTQEVLTKPSAASAFKNFAARNGIEDWPSMVDFLRGAYTQDVYKHAEIKNWLSFNDVPAEESRAIQKILKKMKVEEIQKMIEDGRAKKSK